MPTLRCLNSTQSGMHQIGYIGGGSKVCDDIVVLGMEPLILLGKDNVWTLFCPYETWLSPQRE